MGFFIVISSISKAFVIQVLPFDSNSLDYLCPLAVASQVEPQTYQFLC